MDKDKLIFLSKMIDVVEKEFNANCDTEEAEEFVTLIYDQYKLNGSPGNVKKWLKEALKDYYLSVDKPPKWIEKEPSWPYMNGKPMIFINQFSISKNAVTEKYLTWDNVIYVFGQSLPTEDGKEIKYKIVEQFIGID